MNAPYFTPSFGICKMNGQGPIPKTQHVHDQQMFSLLTNHKSKFQLLRMTGLVVRATEEKNLLPLMLLH